MWSAKPDLVSLLTAINAVKQEVNGLALKLNVAEERISHLEAATYALPSSPSTSIKELETLPTVLTADPIEQTSPRTTFSDESYLAALQSHSCNIELKNCLHEGLSCPNEQPCELQRQLQPISNSIATLMKHILGIEHSIAELVPKNSSELSKSSQSCRTVESEVEENHTQASQGSSPSLKRAAAPKNSWKHPKSPQKQKNGIAIASEKPRAVFGQTSTPVVRRRLPLNVSSSPFESYIDDRSPFSQQIEKKKTHLIKYVHIFIVFAFLLND